MNAVLHFGDNLEWLSRLPDGLVDLCYIDPPFNSQADYNVIIGEAQVKAFTDTWSWGIDDEKAWARLVERGDLVGQWADGMRTAIGPCGMFSYLVFMAERLIEIRRVLKPTGSIYLHCDQAANYHLRLLMDAVFGPQNFRNEIVWCYSGPSVVATAFPRKHDTILFYSSGRKWTFNPDGARVPYAKSLKATRRTEGQGYAATSRGNLTDEEVEERDARGKLVEDWWMGITQVFRSQGERVGYPTQKPLALLERIILASCNPGDVVMDCFLGSGTTAVAAVKNGRNFMGCDIAFHAVDIAMDRLKALEDPPTITLTGHPETVDDARELADHDRFQYQAWALSMVGCNPSGERTSRRGADNGIDGRQVFILRDKSTYTTILSVKSGKPKLGDVRDLIGTVTKENAQRGVLLTLDDPTRDMFRTASSAGLNGFGEAKCIILTAKDLLEGKRLPRIVEAEATAGPIA